MSTALPTHKSEQTGNPLLDRIQNNVRQLVAAVRSLIDAQPVSVMLAETFTTTSATPVATALSFKAKAGECWEVTYSGRGSCSNVAGMGYALGAPPGSTVQGRLTSGTTDSSWANGLFGSIDTANAAIGTCHAGATDAGRPDTFTARIKVGSQGGYISVMAYAVAGTARVYALSAFTGTRTAEVQA